MMKLFCWHNWSKWETTEAFIGEYVLVGGRCNVLIQKRQCPKCGKAELNKQIA